MRKTMSYEQRPIALLATMLYAASPASKGITNSTHAVNAALAIVNETIEATPELVDEVEDLDEAKDDPNGEMVDGPMIRPDGTEPEDEPTG